MCNQVTENMTRDDFHGGGGGRGEAVIVWTKQYDTLWIFRLIHDRQNFHSCMYSTLH